MPEDDAAAALVADSVENSVAFKMLDVLLAQGDITSDAAERAKAKYRAHHAALKDAVAADRRLTQRATALEREATKERARAAAEASASRSRESSAPNSPAALTASATIISTTPPRTPGVRMMTAEEEAAVDRLREDAEAAATEAELAEERERELATEQYRLTRQRDEHKQMIAAVEAEHAAAMAPKIAEIKAESVKLTEETRNDSLEVEELRRERDRIASRLDALASSSTTEREDLDAARDELAELEPVPERIRKQSDVVESGVRGLNASVGKLDAKIAALEHAVETHAAERKKKMDAHDAASETLKNTEIVLEQKMGAVDDMRCDLEREGLEGDKLLADAVRAAQDLRSIDADKNFAVAELKRETKDKETKLRQLRSAELLDEQMKAAIPALVAERDKLAMEVAAMERERRAREEEASATKKEVDARMNEYLKEEKMGKAAAIVFQASYEDVKDLEEEVGHLKREEHERRMFLKELDAQRERLARTARQKKEKANEAFRLLKSKDDEARDLNDKRKDTNRRIGEFISLFDVVRDQKNKFVQLITEASQRGAEMRAKLKILANEIAILREETATKDAQTNTSRVALHNAQTERNALRAEINKAAVIFRAKQTEVDEQLSEMDVLNDAINKAEREMLRTQARYEKSVDARNANGATLIARDDELCALYEKRTVQEEVLKAGETELRKRDDEIKILRAQFAELERARELARRDVADVPKTQEEVASLRAQLAAARATTEKLSAQVEDPKNLARWRPLAGKTPDPKELAAKLEQLDARVEEKTERARELDLMLQEIDALAEQLKDVAVDGREGTLELARRVVAYRARAREVDKKLMATTSELSMYQAAEMKLAAEREDLTEEILEARERLNLGLPPTEDAEREWSRMERSREMLTEQKTRERDEEEEFRRFPNGTWAQSTCEPRPNAYVPTDVTSLGVARPYGKHAPFKPTEAGSTMRHIRKPEPRDILL